MTIKHRVENLEKKSLTGSHGIHVMLTCVGETDEEARQRYCDKNNLDIEKLERGEYGQVINLVKVVVKSKRSIQ
jgi:hypothetical protein